MGVREAVVWCQGHDCVWRWVMRYDGLDEQMKYVRLFFRYFQALTSEVPALRGLSPEQVLDFQDHAVGRIERYLIEDFTNEYVDRMNVAFSTKTSYRGGFRSWFEVNHVPLLRDKSFSFHSEKPMVDRFLSMDDLKRVLLSSSLMYRAVFLCMFQAGMGSNELEYVNKTQSEHILRNLDQRVVELRLPGRKHRKNRYPYYTFIGSDALNAIKEYRRLTHRTSYVPLFVNQYGQPLKRPAIERYLLGRLAKLGVIEVWNPACPSCGEKVFRQRVHHVTRYFCRNCSKDYLFKDFDCSLNETHSVRYRACPHEFRDCFKTEWRRSGAEVLNAEFHMGHDIDRLRYDKLMEKDHTQALNEYRKALPFLNVLSEEPRKIDRLTVLQEMADRDREIASLKDSIREIYERLDVGVEK